MSEIKIHEVGLRDGLQNESRVVPLQTKIEWAEQILATGIDILQLGSFVHPTKVPQMADTDALFEHFKDKRPGAILSGLVLNEKGMERALNCNANMLCMGVSASETHSLKNTGMSVGEATERIIAMALQAQKEPVAIQVSVQSAFGCGFEGKVPEKSVISILEKYFANDLTKISLADTAGHAHPHQVERLISTIYNINPKVNITVHFHNTYGLGIANCVAAMNMGVNTFETAFGGIGGCPFTRVAAGNVATEDFVYFLNRNNKRMDIKLDQIINVSHSAENFFEKKMPGYIINTGYINY